MMVLMSCWRKDALLSSCPMSDYTAIAAAAAPSGTAAVMLMLLIQYASFKMSKFI